MMNDQEKRQAEQTKRARLGREARELLEHPLLVRFFEDEEAKCWIAFSKLGFGVDISAYQAIHHQLIAIKNLKARLEQYVAEWRFDLEEEHRAEQAGNRAADI